MVRIYHASIMCKVLEVSLITFRKRESDKEDKHTFTIETGDRSIIVNNTFDGGKRKNENSVFLI